MKQLKLTLLPPRGRTSRRPVRVVHLNKNVSAAKMNEKVEPSASDLEEAQDTPFGRDSRGFNTSIDYQVPDRSKHTH